MPAFAKSISVENLRSSKWTALTVISFGTFMSTLDGGMISVSYPALAEALETDVSTVLWVTVSYWITAVGLLLTMGWIGDEFGKRRVFIIGSVVFTLGILMSAASLNIWHLIGARIFQGVGSAMVLSNLNALITARFPAEERGMALGVSGAVVGAGLSLGPLLGGPLLDLLDWRALFYTRAPLGVLGIVLAWWLLPNDRAVPNRFRVDIVGTSALFGTLVSILLIVNQGAKLGFASTPIVVTAVVATISLPVLVWAERRSPRPILDRALFRVPQYTFGVAVLVGHYLAYGGVLLVAPFLLVDTLNFSATKMGLFIAAFSMARTFLAPYTGYLSDTLGPRAFLVFGNLLFAVSMLWLSRLGTGTDQWALLMALLVAGAGAAFVEPVVTSVIMGSVPSDRLGTASASVAMGRQVAFSVGVTVAGAIFTIRENAHLAGLSSRVLVNEDGGQEAIALGFSDTMLVGVALALLAAVMSLRLGKGSYTRRPG